MITPLSPSPFTPLPPFPASVGAPSTESDTLTRFEVMDGCPVRGEMIPIRLPLDGLDVAPTMASVSSPFAVRYFLNLVLVDEEDRRYFKQQEVTLWRKEVRGGREAKGSKYRRSSSSAAP